MTDAVKAYEEQPRDQWLFDYPAQVSLCGTQIWWTSEVSRLYFCSCDLMLLKDFILTFLTKLFNISVDKNIFSPS